MGSTLKYRVGQNGLWYVKCGSADVDTCKMRMRMRIFLCAVYFAEAGLLLRTEDCTPMLGRTNYTQVLDERFMTCKLRNCFNEVLK